jgi:hypothetical protein
MGRGKKKEEGGGTTRRAALTLVGVVLFGVVGVGATLGFAEVDRRAAAALAARNGDVVIRFPLIGDDAAKGTWMPASEQERLKVAAFIAAGDPDAEGMFTRRALADVGAALHATGWFSVPPRVERRADGGLLVDGPWRVPAAVVRRGDRETLVSWDGVALPLEYSAGGSGVRYLKNPSAEPARGVHAAWPGKDVREGLDLLDLLDDDAAVIAQVKGIDLASGGSMVIETESGGRVVWGAGPKASRPGEMSTAQKLARVRALLKQTGRIDGGARVVEIHGPSVFLGRE